ncbi:tetratricopeptide repeat protein [Diaphorobacter ruginosibacter]|uniref:Tetratricopeptide repeat protein n=1 Tax=Diaphorobacter ruginosibacter TaxID=1715720 RepID=A0A7G9RTK9_9BURK|nr:tetratricopeptide repeat protein [Diaphorobacter ruginosibacter]QNN58934.1 tetratricopeptide repeat protein [Diaphorobacter ruginosibacter]
MTLPWHSLDTTLFSRAQQLLDEGWITRDPELAPVLPVVLERGVGQDWHKAGTFRHHLYGVARSLALWQQPHDVQLLGLLHSVYGNAFVDLVKFDARTERARLQGLVGEEAEHLVHLFCTMSRSQFINKVLERDFDEDGGMELELNGPAPRETVQLTPREVAAFIIVSMADTIEQWFSWQEEIYSRSPNVDTSRKQAVHWAASLWPGPMRPPSRKISQLSQLGLALQHPGLAGLLPMPPVFNRCTVSVSKEDDAAASSLYWSVIQLDQPLVDLDVATHVLEQAVRLNPWVGEPQMVLAQVYLSAGRQDDAVLAARSALQCFSAWGNAWDKRVQWDAWIAWTRILLQSATDGTWPERLDKLNNLALRG